MTAALVERIIAVIGSLIVGGTASLQLKSEWALHGIDAQVTKLLLGLMILGCVFALLAGINVLGRFS